MSDMQKEETGMN